MEVVGWAADADFAALRRLLVWKLMTGLTGRPGGGRGGGRRAKNTQPYVLARFSFSFHLSISCEKKGGIKTSLTSL